MTKEKKEDQKDRTVKPAKPDNIGRNDPCYCGSGKKYKKCHLQEDEAAEHKILEERDALQKAEAAKASAENKEKRPLQDKHNHKDNYKANLHGTNNSTRTLFNRKLGDG
jgi:hypothetical protein